MIAGHRHTIVFTNMVVQCGVIRHPVFTEGTKSHCDSVYPIRACLAASHRQPQRKTPGPDIPQPYATPKKMSAAGRDAMINKDLGSENVYDPLQSRNTSPTPGP